MPERISSFFFAHYTSETVRLSKCVPQPILLNIRKMQKQLRVLSLSFRLTIATYQQLKQRALDFFSEMIQEERDTKRSHQGTWRNASRELRSHRRWISNGTQENRGLISWLKLMGLSARNNRSPAVGEKLFSSLCFNSNCCLMWNEHISGVL